MTASPLELRTPRLTLVPVTLESEEGATMFELKRR
jgi:hypothetical protein